MPDAPLSRPSHGGDNPTLTTLLVDQQSRWRRGERVLVEAYLAQQPPLSGDREAVLELILHEMLLRQECGETPVLAEYQVRFPHLAEPLAIQFEVENAVDSPSSGLIEPPTTLQELAAPTAPASESATRPLLSGYEIVGELGRGGMGVVYKARQVALKRLVALKMLLGGGRAGPEELARFRREAESVARLQHANIVQVYEVGEHDGQPCFALELVEGGTLAQKLAGAPQPPRQAAGLTATLARAMYYAHQRGVVHRDLKPANVLMTADGTPKITDFGLAKKLDEQGQTQTGAIMGTPSYMAPEQAAGKKDVGPAVDVYALGAILYEMLTGRPPFQGETAWDTVAQVLTEEPVSPVRLQPRVPRDLDTICLKCLHKEPGKRYADGEALAEDLRRFQAGEAIQARPVGRMERAWRWSRRNPVVASLLAALFLVVAGGFSAVTVLWRHAVAKSVEAEQQRVKAEVSFQEAEANFQTAFRAIDDYFTRVSEQRLLNEPGLQPLRKELLQTAQRYYEKFVAERGDDPSTRYELAKAYLRLGQITHAIGSKPHAIELLEKAVAMLEPLVAEDTGDSRQERDLATCLNTLGDFHDQARDMARAEVVLNKARAIRTRIAMKHPGDSAFQKDLGESTLNLGRSYYLSGRLARAEAAFHEALDILVKLPANAGVQRALAMTYNNLGHICDSTNRSHLAEKSHLKALALRGRLVEKHGDNQQYQSDLSMSHHNLGSLYLKLDRREEALAAYKKALAIREKLARENPVDTFRQSDVALVQRNLFGLYLEMGQVEPAEKAHHQIKEILEKLIDRHPTLPEFQAELANSYNNLGVLYQRTNQMGKAQATYDQTREVWDQLRRKHPMILDYRAGLARAHHNLGNIHSRMGQRDKACSAYEEAVKLLDGLARDGPTVERYRYDLAEAHNELGHLYLSIHRTAQAEASYRKAQLIRENLASGNPFVPDYQSNVAASWSALGNLYHNARKHTQAEKAHRKALKLQKVLADAYPKNNFYQQSLAGSHHNLGAVHEDSGRPREAEASYRDALKIKETLVRAYPKEFRFALDVAFTYRNLGALTRKKAPQVALEWYARAIRAAAPVVRQAPQNAWARESLFSAHEESAAIWKQLGQPAKGLADLDRLIDLAQPAAHDYWRLQRALTLAQMGDYTRAAAEADALAKGKSVSGNDLYNLACIHGLAAAAVRKDAKQTQAEQDRRAEQYAGRAIELLRQAVQRGYKDLEHLKKDEDLVSLRKRDDFKKLLAELAEKGKGAGP